eukprot:SAG22_NODE_2334_length_2704_cov_1.163532_3_plen_81_part_00
MAATGGCCRGRRPARRRGEATVMLLKAVTTAFPSVSLPFLAVPLRSPRCRRLAGGRDGLEEDEPEAVWARGANCDFSKGA